MPQTPPSAWPEPLPPAPPTPPEPPSRAPWAPLAIIGGAAVLVAIVVTLVGVLPEDAPTAAPDDQLASSATTGGVGPRPSTSRPVAPPPVATVPPPTTTPLPAGGWPVDLSLAELETALLTEGDLGMQDVSGDPPDIIDSIPVQDFEADAPCEEMMHRYDAIGFRPLFGGGLPRAPRRATVELAGFGGTVEHEVGDGLQVTVADLRALFETCTEIRLTKGTVSDTLTVREGVPVSVGDDSVSLQYSLEGDGAGTPPVLWVLWERDSIISSVSITWGDADALSLLEDAVLIADRRLEAVIG